MVNASSAAIPPDMVYAPVDIPDAVRLDTLDVATLPENWFDSPPPSECRLAGDAWAKRTETVGLIVPSAVSRIDNNVLFNPAHPDFARLIIGNAGVMEIDHRFKRVR